MGIAKAGRALFRACGQLSHLRLMMVLITMLVVMTMAMTVVVTYWHLATILMTMMMMVTCNCKATGALFRAGDQVALDRRHNILSGPTPHTAHSTKHTTHNTQHTAHSTQHNRAYSTISYLDQPAPHGC